MEPTRSTLNSASPDAPQISNTPEAGSPASINVPANAPAPARPTSKPPRRPRSKLAIAVIVAVVMIVAAVATVAVLLAKGSLYIGFKQPEQKKVVAQTVVCGSDIVSKYNENIYSEAAAKQEQDKFDDLIKEIKTNSNYINDATCQTILFVYAFSKGDGSEMRSALSAIESLNKNGIFANNSLIKTYSIPVMQTLANGTLNEKHE